MNSIDIDEITTGLAGSVIGRRIHFLEETDSTNTYAMRLAVLGAEEGEVVIAESQTDGRGRLRGRSWQSLPGVNLYFSVILRPSISPTVAASMTLMAGVAVADVLSEYCPGKVHLKWPNDVLIEEKKICGILTEMKTREGVIEYVIVGIGINLNIEKKDFREEFRARSTSLRNELSYVVSRSEIASKVFKALDLWYHAFLVEGFAPVRAKWLDYTGLLGRQIEVQGAGSIETGLVLGIDEEGALILEDAESRIIKIISGDVFLKEGE